MTPLRTRFVVLTAYLIAVLPALLAPAGPATAAEDPESPLVVQLTELQPATIPAAGPVVLAGSVRNDSDETWSAINVHPFLSHTPMTTREDVAEAAASDSTIEVGRRITTIGQFATIGDLAPGQSASFRIRLLRRELPISGGAGVYWIGVHALGQNADGRDDQADGRARTFIPLVGAGVGTVTPTEVAVVVPVRERVRRDPVGRVLNPTAWAATLAPDGRLRRVLDLLMSAGARRPTLLLDPAVLEAVESLAADNPPMTLGTAEPGTPTTSPSPAPKSPTDAPSRALDRLDPAERASAASWLSGILSVSATHAVLGLGYADPDTAALARQRPTMLSRAEREAAATFQRLAVTATPAVAPPNGWLDDNALRSITAGATILVSDHSAPRTRTQWRTAQDQDLLFTDAQASSGGPGPGAPLEALALRQRILADAALRAAAGDRAPMIVQLPSAWDPGAEWRAADFFGGLDQPWLNLVPATGSPDRATPVFDAALAYPAAIQRQEIGDPNVLASGSLIRSGTTLEEILRTENTVAHQVTATALTGVSYQARRDRAEARRQVLAADAAVGSRLAKVSVSGTDFVTLSGGSGTVTVTLANDLDKPVRVGVKAETGSSGVSISTPDPVDLAPGQKTVLRLRARSEEIGVHQVTLTPVSESGLTFGTPLTFSLRTTQVGVLIWVVLGAAGVLLVVMIVRRILRGLREHRWRGQ